MSRHTMSRSIARVAVAVACGAALNAVSGCGASDDPAQDELAQHVAVAPSAQHAPGPRPSERLRQYQMHAPPALASAGQVAPFLDWAGASHADERADVHAVIAASANRPEVVQALIDEVERVQAVDLSRALLALAMLGETRTAAAEAYFTEFAWRPLPQTGTVVEGEILEQTQAAQLQAKAIDGLAYRNTDSANQQVMAIIAKHPSRIVRAEAINAYLWNRGDSDEARQALAHVVRKDEQVFLDRVRRVPGEPASVFNAKLARFLQRHPELTPPVPVRGDAAPSSDPPARSSAAPPAF